MAKRKRITPGRAWRLSAYQGDGRSRVNVENVGTFDELVVDGWIHLEQMNRSLWWLRLGDRTFWVRVGADGSASKIVEDGTESAPAASREGNER